MVTKRTLKSDIREQQNVKTRIRHTLYDVLLIIAFITIQPFIIQGIGESISAYQNHRFTNEHFGSILAGIAYLYIAWRCIISEYRYGTTNPKEYAEYKQHKKAIH